MRFHYSLQKIVDLKANEKAQAEWGLSQAVGRLQLEEHSLTALHAEEEQLHQEVMGASASTTASDLMRYQEYMSHLGRQIRHKRDDVEQAKQLVDSRKEALTGKMKEEKIWLKARERAFETFRLSENKQEQQQLDELATSRHRFLG